MTEKKKILVFCGGNKVFGAEIVTLSILKELKAAGYAIFCITSGWNDGLFHKKLEDLNIPYKAVKLGFVFLSKPLWTLDSLIHYPGAMLGIKRVLDKFKPDVLYHVSSSPILVASPLLRNRKNILFVFDPHYGKRSRRYFKWLNNLVNTYVAVSEAIKLNLIEIGVSAECILVLKNGIDISTTSRQRDLNDVIHFGIVGQIVPRKGHEDVIEAFRILKDQNSVARCVIIGSGDLNFINFLKEKVSSYGLGQAVSWLSFIENRDEIYRAFDVSLVPSTTLDPLPTAAMEAGLYYKPCIVTRMGGLPEIVIDDTTGFIVDAHSPGQLADRMNLLITDRDRIVTMGKAAHQHIATNFDVKSQVKLLFPILDS